MTSMFFQFNLKWKENHNIILTLIDNCEIFHVSTIHLSKPFFESRFVWKFNNKKTHLYHIGNTEIVSWFPISFDEKRKKLQSRRKRMVKSTEIIDPSLKIGTARPQYEYIQYTILLQLQLRSSLVCLAGASFKALSPNAVRITLLLASSNNSRQSAGHIKDSHGSVVVSQWLGCSGGSLNSYSVESPLP
jgi:hypothetical protein